MCRRSTRLPSPPRLSAEFAAVGIAGGAVYVGLVGACAVAAGATLLSCDRRAMASYPALGVDVLLVG